MSQHLGDRAGAYVDGVLDAAETARARAHLSSCASCRATVAEQERVRDVLRAASRPQTAPPPGLLAALAAMPVSGPPVRLSAPEPAGRRGATARRTAVSCVALAATVLGTAWVVGGQAVAEGPPAVPPANLLAQHTATAGELPFWGARPAAVSPRTVTHKVRLRTHDGMSRWVTRDPSSILRRAAAASTSLSYQAVEQVTTYDGDTPVTLVAQVSHVSGQGTSTRPVGALATSSAGAVFQPQVEGQAASSLDAVALLEQTYQVTAEGVDLVAGRTVDRLAVHAADGQLVARFWIDRASGLPLARETRTDDGTAVGHRMTAVSVSGRVLLPVHLPVATSAVWGEAVGIPAPDALEVLDAEGWVCPEGLGDAAGLQAFDVLVTDADASASKGQVLHIIYTDGLRAVSVFQQHAVLTRQRLAGFTLDRVGDATVYRRGALPTEVTWAAGGMVFTVVGDVPDDVLDHVVAALPHDNADAGSRTGRGLARVGSWIDPFG